MDINNINPMVRMMIERAVGKDNFNNMLNQWNAMSPEQKQAEMSKVSGMTPQQRNEYLMNRGINVNGMGVQEPTQPIQKPIQTVNRFKY